MTVQKIGPLTHVPEWCEQTDGTHDPTCPEAPMVDYTKGTFVAGAQQSAKAVIEAYVVAIADGLTPADAVDIAVQDAEEAAICFAGIGSCGRGWCKHS